MEDTYDIFLQKRHDLITKNVQELLSSKYNSLSKTDINKLVDKKIDELKKTNLDKIDYRTEEEKSENIPMIKLNKREILYNLQSYHDLKYFNVEIESKDLDKNLQGLYRYKDYEMITDTVNGYSIFRTLYSKIIDEQIYNLEIEFYDETEFKLKLMIKDKNNKTQNTFIHDSKLPDLIAGGEGAYNWTAKQNTLKVKDKSGKIFPLKLKICNNKNILDKEKVKKTKKKKRATRRSRSRSHSDYDLDFTNNLEGFQRTGGSRSGSPAPQRSRSGSNDSSGSMMSYVNQSSDYSTDNENSSRRRSPLPRRSRSPGRRSPSPGRRSPSPRRRWLTPPLIYPVSL